MYSSPIPITDNSMKFFPKSTACRSTIWNGPFHNSGQILNQCWPKNRFADFGLISNQLACQGRFQNNRSCTRFRNSRTWNESFNQDEKTKKPSGYNFKWIKTIHNKPVYELGRLSITKLEGQEIHHRFGNLCGEFKYYEKSWFIGNTSLNIK